MRGDSRGVDIGSIAAEEAGSCWALEACSYCFVLDSSLDTWVWSGSCLTEETGVV